MEVLWFWYNIEKYYTIRSVANGMKTIAYTAVQYGIISAYYTMKAVWDKPAYLQR
ncbi:hypothetical protein AALA98_09820 [Lachnospiraceae bacterium 45-W7]